MRALVTGAAGFIGSHLAEHLLASGVEVRGVDNLAPYYEPAIKRGNLEGLEGESSFELIEGDINDLDPLALLEDVEVVYHLAGQPGVRVSWGQEFEIYLVQNALTTQRLLEAARERPLSRFVLASSSSVYGNAQRFPTAESDPTVPVSPYGVTKLAAENLCQLYWQTFGVPSVTLRYFTIFGPRQRPDMAFSRFVSAALEDRPIEIFGDGLQSRDFTYVEDAIAATVAAGERGVLGSTYNIAGGTQLTVIDVIETLGRLLETELQVEFHGAVKGDARKTGADITAARRDLGYAPSVTLEEGLTRQLDAARERARSG